MNFFPCVVVRFVLFGLLDVTTVCCCCCCCCSFVRLVASFTSLCDFPHDCGAQHLVIQFPVPFHLDAWQFAIVFLVFLWLGWCLAVFCSVCSFLCGSNCRFPCTNSITCLSLLNAMKLNVSVIQSCFLCTLFSFFFALVSWSLFESWRPGIFITQHFSSLQHFYLVYWIVTVLTLNDVVGFARWHCVFPTLVKCWAHSVGQSFGIRHSITIALCCFLFCALWSS